MLAHNKNYQICEAGKDPQFGANENRLKEGDSEISGMTELADLKIVTINILKDLKKNMKMREIQDLTNSQDGLNNKLDTT